MKTKSLALLLIFTFSLLSFNPVQAGSGIDHPLNDALLMLYTSEAILLGDGETQETSQLHNLSAPKFDDPIEFPDDEAIAAYLQALKDMRNDLDTNCRLLQSYYREQGKDCEAERVGVFCDAYRDEINGEIGYYHDVRGDRRKALTKVGHFFKRTARNIYHRIGPIGRTFLRRLGPEVAQIVISGGTLSGGTVRKLVKQVPRTIGREKIKKIVFHGVDRLLKGQIEILQAAGVDICDLESEIIEVEDIELEDITSQAEYLSYTLTTKEVDFRWPSLLEPEVPDDEYHHCGSLWAGEDDAFEPIEFEVSFDFENELLYAQFQGSRNIENLSEGTTGDVVSIQDQSFIVNIDGPYQLEEPTEGVFLSFTGYAEVTLTMEGERECHYWTEPNFGELVLNKYWISNDGSLTIDCPYQLGIYTEDGIKGRLSFLLTTGPKPWAENSGFTVDTFNLELSEEDLQAFWPE